MFPDILLQIDSYPEPTSTQALDQAIGFVAAVGGKLSAMALEIDIRVHPNWLANIAAGVEKLIEAEEERSRASCRTTLEYFTSAANRAGVYSGARTCRSDYAAAGLDVAKFARCRDFCIVPVTTSDDGQRSVADDIVFGSGRGTLVFQPGLSDLPQQIPKEVVLAWDGSRSASRAMADALPILAISKHVTVLSVLNEKASVEAGAGEDVTRHLQLHGVNASIAEIDGAGRSIGRSLDDFCQASAAELLVMGAYGRSRLRDFILGGATEHVLKHRRIAVFIAH